MHKFKDNKDREWVVELDGYQLKNLKNSPLNFDARDLQSILQAANDPVLLCDVLYVLCGEQAKEWNVSDRDFGRALKGDAIEAATEAYIQETIDFFPQRQRQSLISALAKVTEAINRAMKLAEEKLQSPQMEQMIVRLLSESSQKIDESLAGTTIGSSSGNSRA